MRSSTLILEDIVNHDVGANFDSTEFCVKAKMFGIMCHQILVEAHWSIEKVEKYHAPVRRAYNIIQAEIRGIISKNAILQIVFKAVYDTVGPDGLVPTLLVFDAYPRIVIDSPPTFLQQ